MTIFHELYHHIIEQWGCVDSDEELNAERFARSKKFRDERLKKGDDVKWKEKKLWILIQGIGSISFGWVRQGKGKKPLHVSKRVMGFDEVWAHFGLVRGERRREKKCLLI